VLEWWRVGVLVVIETEANDKPGNLKMENITCSVIVVGQRQIQDARVSQIEQLNRCEAPFPLLQYSITPDD
jgi:hypothetical protein